MRGKMKRNLCLALAAGLLAAGAAAPGAMGYFTSYTEAAGQKEIELKFTTTIPEEEVSEWTKHVVIENTGSRDCYVRVRAYAGAGYQEALRYEGENWTPGADGWYYYGKILAPGEKAEDELLIHIDNLGEEEDFNVIVVQECTGVRYDSDGTPYADWDNVLDYMGENEEGGAEG